MLKERTKKKIPLALSLGLLLAALLGATTLALRWTGLWERYLGGDGESTPKTTLVEQQPDEESEVLQLVSQSATARASSLEAIATGKKSLDRSRARYLLATDLIAQERGEEALKWLKGLEKEYPTLAPQIAWKRAVAYQLTGDTGKAEANFKKVIDDYPESPVVPEALYVLGQTDSESWQAAIADFPTHPRTIEIMLQSLAEDPNQPQLMISLIKNAPQAEGIAAIRARLIDKYAGELAPSDWEAIADTYWEQQEYGRAAETYKEATPNAENAYRVARGYHIQNKKDLAKSAYRQLIAEYPDADDTAQGLFHLASLSEPKEAVQYFDQIIENFSDRAPEALVAKTELLNDPQQAAETRQLLLSKYPKSEAAAEYRWKLAKESANSGDILAAWEWAGPIPTNNPDSDLAPKAGFWVGKWAQQLERTEDAQKAFEYVIEQHPQSYYAWRSAVYLGWDVGDFDTVRNLIPEVAKPDFRPRPPAGSDLFKELFQLGQDEDAQTLFQAEVGGKEQLSVNEQFTQGLILLTEGKNIQAIDKVWSLKLREAPEEQAEWQQLRETPEYWQALFPFPYNELIIKWSKEREINPLLVTSLIRQESRFEKEITSGAGAVGLMQVLPSTAEDVANRIDLEEYSLTDPSDNILLGSTYLDFVHEQYNNNSMLAIASYNAGPGNVASWLQQYSFSDTDRFIEQIPFPETKGYVESVFANYWNYLRLYNPEIMRLMSP
ncbi:MAG: transglycosylase SLT domain-containing protein [Oscillatoria sp. PMC 1068.18]|nr:transglycosylase SLT domain-containing protein [Oscillatoria sp. PMC 1076.18]MEC4988497.1 transglycosylase SLT domain-containing protein [Oscillatoria sp. PMC 1068.18]